MKKKGSELNKVSLPVIGLVFVSLVFFGVGLRNMDNCIDWMEYGAVALFLGGVFGLILFVVTERFFMPKMKPYKRNQGSGLFGPFVLSFAFIFFGLGAIINEYSFIKRDCKSYTIKDLGESGSKSRAYYVFIVNDSGRKERLSFGKEFNEYHNVGDQINLCITTGRLGVRYYQYQH